uniref:DIX domain containing 1 n=1 Tax=Loxodonta africana TaxID=9785 RepID=G3T5H8_LOXAF
MFSCSLRGSLLCSLSAFIFQQQLQAYVAWVNAQLKKRPAVKPVQDLRQDLRDGVILAYLIEIVAGEKLSGVQLSPSNQQEMKNNVEKVLHFVTSKKIRMHQTSAKDIVEGNLKSIMRLVLALAAHFKPGSSRMVSQGRDSSTPLQSHQPHCATAVAQGAAAALADVCHDVSRSGRDVFRYRQRNSVGEEIENPYWSVRALVQQYEGQQRSPSESSCSSLTLLEISHSLTPKGIIMATMSVSRGHFLPLPALLSNLESRSEIDYPVSRDWQPRSPGTYLETSWEEQLLEQQEHLEKEMEETKKMISGLQALLLNGSLPEDEQERPLALCEPGVKLEEQLIIIQSRLDQSMEENQDLKKEVLKCKQEARNLQGIKDALQQRLAQQDTSVLQLKQELLRANMDKDELHNQNVDLQRKLDERNRLLGEYKKELGQKDRLLQQHQAKLEEALRKLSEASYQQVDLERELEHKDVFLAHCMKREADEVTTYNSHSSQSNGFLLPVAGKGAAAITHRGTSDLQLFRDALRSLRNSFSGHDPQHHTIDSLEQGISSLMERLHIMETQKKRERRVRGKSPRTQAGSEYQESWPPNSKLPHSQSSPAISSSCTKVLYFTDRSLTPFMVNIPKRLGEVTLKDFKAAIDREGNHRYHFKALDPEFGTVKEEVFHDDDAIPGWEGKIVAWVEEDHGEN